MKLLISILLGLVLAADGKGGGPKPFRKSKPFRPRQSLAKSLELRGGAGPLDRMRVAKATNAFVLASNTLNWLGPEKTLKLYGITDVSPKNLIMWQRMNAIFQSGVITAYCILFPKTSVNHAIGYGTLPFLLDIVRSVLNDDEKKVGISDAGQLLLVVAPLLVVAYACFSDHGKANDIVTICGAYHAARGLYYLLNPTRACESWGMSGGDDSFYFLVKWVGVALISNATYIISLAQGVEVLKAGGYSWVPFTLYAIWTTIITGEQPEKSLFYPWIAMGLVNFWTLSV